MKNPKITRVVLYSHHGHVKKKYVKYKSLRQSNPQWFGHNSYMTKPMKTVLMKISFFCTKCAKDHKFKIFETVKITDCDGKRKRRVHKGRTEEEKGWYSFLAGIKRLDRNRSWRRGGGRSEIFTKSFSQIQTYNYYNCYNYDHNLWLINLLITGCKGPGYVYPNISMSSL